MDNLTDFDNAEDVSDAAIEWVLRETGSPAFPVESVRSDARLGRGYPADCARILAARLIQRHHPELLVDPDLLEAREIAAKYWGRADAAEEYRAGKWDDASHVVVALAAIKRGRELGLPKPLTQEMVVKAHQKALGDFGSLSIHRLHAALMEQMK